MANHVFIAQNVHVLRVAHGPADLALSITDVSGDEVRVALSKVQAEKLADLLEAHSRSKGS